MYKNYNNGETSTTYSYLSAFTSPVFSQFTISIVTVKENVMKIKKCIKLYNVASLVLIFSSQTFSQTSSSFNVQAMLHYPLHGGDRWEYNSKLSKVLKDTTMSNGKKYSMIVHSDTLLGRTRYERTDSNKVFRFNPVTTQEELWFDFDAQAGDTVSKIPRGDDTLVIIFEETDTTMVIGSKRVVRTYSILNKSTNMKEYVSIADSIGIVHYAFTELQPDGFVITGALINGKLFRTSYSSIYLPLQVGNYWLFGSDKISVEKDTLMPNLKTYALMQWQLVTNMGNKIFLRQDKNYIFRYNTSTQEEEIEIDFSAPAGQTYELTFTNFDNRNIVRTSGGMNSSQVFSSQRTIFSYLYDIQPIIDDEEIYTYADSIGIIQVEGQWHNSKITQAYVNGKIYIATSVGIMQTSLPKKILLEHNYPNPFNPNTIIGYQLSIRSHVTLKIYDAIGREIATLVDGIKEAGYHQVSWDATNDKGEQVSSGIYFYRLEVDNTFVTKKAIYLR